MVRPDQISDADYAISKGAQSILDVAERLFSEQGFDGVSINDIARKADVSKANIFHHFKSKHGLYMAVLKGACVHSSEALDNVERTLTDGSQAQLKAFFTDHLQALLAHPISSRLIQRELLEHGSEGGRQLAEEVFAESFSRLVRLIREGQFKDMLRKDFDPALLAFLLVSANVLFFEARSVLEHLPEVDFAASPGHYSAAMFELLSRGFSKGS